MIYTVETPNTVTDAILAGQCFWWSTAAAGVAIAPAAAGSAPMIWNPSDSNRNLHVIQVNFGYVSGTTVAQHLAWAVLPNAGAQIGTAQPIVSYTAGNPVNALVGAGAASHMRFAPLTCSVTAPTYMNTYGMSAGGAQAAGPMYELVDWTWGKIIIPPGNAFFPAVSGNTITLTAAVAVFGWEQVIAPGGG